MRVFCLLFFLLSSISALAQTPEYVYVEKGLGQLRGGCILENEAVSPSKYKRILEDPSCAKLIPGDIDLSKKTLITYRVGGDCRMRVSSFVTLNRTEKQIVINIENIWGRCRAGGSYNGWLVIDKIPENHSVIFKKRKFDKQLDALPFKLSPTQHWNMFPTGNHVPELDVKGCLNVRIRGPIHLKSRNELFERMKNSASETRCVNFARKFDFEKYALVGANISTGYCRKPIGFKVILQEYAGSDLFQINAMYIRPVGVCRALSRYSFWIKIPKRARTQELLVKHRLRPRILR